jgi:hypothetical protein
MYSLQFIPNFCRLLALAKHSVLKTPNFFFIAVSDQLLDPNKTGKIIVLYTLILKFLHPVFEMVSILQ